MNISIQSGDTLSKIAKKHGITLDALLEANPQYRANPHLIRVGDKVTLPVPASAATPLEALAPPAAVAASSSTPPAEDSDFIVPAGQLTFDAEGLEKRGPFFSRKAHVPSDTSGVTLGRGYDMKTKSAEKIEQELISSGIDPELAKRFGAATGLSGDGGRQFIRDQGLDSVEITPAQQKALFQISYSELEQDVVRLCNKPDVVETYGATDWDNLEPRIRDVVVDLRFRGDYSPATRKVAQKTIASGKLDAFLVIMSDKNFWQGDRGVPSDRFKRRRDYLA